VARTARVVFEPEGLSAEVEHGVTVSQAGRKAGIVIPLPCGGRGICTGCGVRVLEGDLEPPDPIEQSTLARSPGDVRLACRARIAGDVALRPLVAYQVRRPSEAPSTCTGLEVGVDLGTTTVGAVVHDGESVAERGRAGVANVQQRWGADVLSRLEAAIGGASETLRSDAEESVVNAIEAAASEAGCRADGVASLVIVANSVMAALLLGIDASPLAAHPFTAPIDGVTELAADSGIRKAIGPDAHAVVLPSIAAFVGGDVIAGLMATGMLERAGTRMLLDLGTNAEFALSVESGLYVASAPAGPALEAGGAACGGPAVDGAVTAVTINTAGRVDLETIGVSAPAWYCGSGLISAVKALRDVGAVDPDGLLTAIPLLSDRFDRDDEDVLGVELGPLPRGSGGCVRVDQRDIRSLQLAKSAVRAGIDGVLSAADTEAERVDKVYVAGAFGAALDAEDLLALGMVPLAWSDRMEIIGDAALTGAGMMATEDELAAWASERADRAMHVELAAQGDFAEKLLVGVRLEPS
jgi:uncharacterized 2Fe-2S/4Fe-4S cluster protein (DUF4445 family)